MLQAVACRVKFLFWLALFFAPVAIAAWGQSIDRELLENAYLPAPPFAQVVSFAE